MIAFLKGTLIQKNPHSVVVDVKGVGYEVNVPLSTFYHLSEQEGDVSLHIYTHVRDDALQLFGFRTTMEKDLFLMLIAVSGIGPKLALNILSGIGPGELLEAIAEGDSPSLQAIPGVGRKTAERISLELKDRAIKARTQAEVPALQKRALSPSGPLADDAFSALLNLGYSAKAARQAVEKARVSTTESGLEALIREALRQLV